MFLWRPIVDCDDRESVYFVLMNEDGRRSINKDRREQPFGRVIQITRQSASISYGGVVCYFNRHYYALAPHTRVVPQTFAAQYHNSHNYYCSTNKEDAA